jgi:hypothetical protein
MSDLEIEKAAMGPHRWIELCGAFEKDDSGSVLCPRAIRFINDSVTTDFNYFITDFFIVPGGRYLVGSSRYNIFVLDLGYTPSSDCKLIASVGLEGLLRTSIVQATPNGMGLIIFLSYFL